MPIRTRVRPAPSRAGRPGYRPLVLGGLVLGAVAAVLALARRRRRGDPGREDTPPAEGPGSRTPAAGGIEERVRAGIQADPRTRDLTPPNIRVDEGMAWIEGEVPSPEAKKALTEVVGGVEGVNIVVNRVVVRKP